MSGTRAIMSVKSAAGGFEVEVDAIQAQDGKLVLLGTLDGMDCRTEVANGEVLKLVRLGCKPDVIRALLKQLLSRRRGTP
jgi:hypothetical protein